MKRIRKTTEMQQRSSRSDESKEADADRRDRHSRRKKEPEKTTIFYVTDEIQQSQYINMFKEAGKDAVILKHNIDSSIYFSAWSRKIRMYSLRELMQI